MCEFENVQMEYRELSCFVLNATHKAFSNLQIR